VEIRVREGESAPVGAVLAVLGGETEGRSRPVERGAVTVQAERLRESAPERPATSGPPKTKPGPVPRAVPSEQPALRTVATGAPRLRASPLAQRLARERGVDLKGVLGSGAEGKIVARDVKPAAAAPVAARVVPAPEPGRLELSRMRRSIARRMTEAKQQIPHFYVTAEIEMSEAARLLAALKDQVDPQITVSHLVVKAAAMALLEHPRVNGQWVEGAIEIPGAVNIGLAVAVDDGLIVPVIHGCDKRMLPEIATEARRLVAAAREGGFAGDDLKGATFSISNLGILDVDEFSAIINPPQAAILAVGSIKQRPVVRAGQVAVGKTMRVTLSCDHRQLNGVEGARYLETLRSILENPLRMVV
jgi:pyruvate dehydrogenase E2 component (dihydrolipoamide acetyltransferase)